MKTAAVTGGSGGLGNAVLKALKKNGYRVVNISRRKCADADENIIADLTAAEAPETIAAGLDRLDLLVNNAGIGAYGTFQELTCDELRKVMEIDFFAPIKLVNALLPELEKSHGTIVNIASMAAKIHVPAMGGYCAAKSAFAAYSETSRVELGRRGVRVLTIYPGRVDTGFSQRAIKYREVPDTPGNSGVTADMFAEKLLKALAKPRVKRLFFPWWYRPGTILAKLFEDFYNRKNVELWKL
ncbi:MAG: SDR family NAD(P)-dependent oxidoreductase [Victivallaceae bacterium]|nr:SDR family NAD(P)-dependent oxidoreductase [Victivallaceae bacterium]